MFPLIPLGLPISPPQSLMVHKFSLKNIKWGGGNKLNLLSICFACRRPKFGLLNLIAPSNHLPEQSFKQSEE